MDLYGYIVTRPSENNFCKIEMKCWHTFVCLTRNLQNLTFCNLLISPVQMAGGETFKKMSENNYCKIEMNLDGE